MLPAVVAAFAAGALLGLGLGAGRGRAARLRHAFVSAVSHDLRTPLTHIRLLAESLLLGSAASAEERDRWLRAILREARVLDDRIANVLMYAHGDGLSPALPLRRTELRGMLAELAGEYGPVAEARGMRLRLADGVAVQADAEPAALRQAMVNLVDNALRYGPEGQTVTLAVHRADGRATLSVSDQGPGMSGPAGAGAGLGLALVRRVAARHAGQTSIAALPAGGSRVSISLPAAAE